MNLGDDRGIKTPQWLSNMVLRADDLDITSQSSYQNITDQMALSASQDVVDEVIQGLILTPTSLLTCSLSAGAAVSFSGKYVEADTWGFTAGAGDVFSVINPKDQVVGFATADPTNPRIDIVEVRPVETPYNEVSRQFKDPITESITSSLTYTRKEYGVEVQVVEGTAGPLVPETTTFEFISGTVSDYTGKYLTFDTSDGGYYVWWFVDGFGVDPAIPGRTGMMVSMLAAFHTTKEDICNVTESVMDNATGCTMYDVDEFVYITNDAPGNVSDATIGDMDAGDLSVTVTQQGNGAPAQTPGWIKLAEVYVSAAQTTLVDMDIRTWKGSAGWVGVESTKQPLEMTEDVSIDVPLGWDRGAIHRLWASQPKNFNGHTLTFRFTTGTYAITGGDLEFNDAYNGRLRLRDISGTPIFDMDGSTITVIPESTHGNLDVEVIDFDIYEGSFYGVGKRNSSIEFTDFNVDPTTLADTPITLSEYNQVEFNNCAVNATGGAPGYRRAVSIGDCSLVIDLPTMTGDLGEYHLTAYDSNFTNSDNLVTGSLGEIDPLSSKYVLLDKTKVIHDANVEYDVDGGFEREVANLVTTVTGGVTIQLPAGYAVHDCVWIPNGWYDYDDDRLGAWCTVIANGATSDVYMLHPNRNPSGNQYYDATNATTMGVPSSLNYNFGGGGSVRTNEDGSRIVILTVVGAYYRVHLSTDGGETWTLQTQDITASGSIVVGPVYYNFGKFWFWTLTGVLHSSTDGITWVVVHDVGASINAYRARLITDVYGEEDYVLATEYDAGNINSWKWDGTTVTALTTYVGGGDFSGGLIGAMRHKGVVYMYNNSSSVGTYNAGVYLILNEATGVWSLGGSNRLALPDPGIDFSTNWWFANSTHIFTNFPTEVGDNIESGVGRNIGYGSGISMQPDWMGEKVDYPGATTTGGIKVLRVVNLSKIVRWYNQICEQYHGV